MQSLSDQATAIQKLLNAVHDNSYKFLTAVAAVGVLSMAIIQTIKDMLPVRNWFQQYFVRRWLRNKAELASMKWQLWIKERGQNWFFEEGIKDDPPSSAPSTQQAEQDLIKLATDGDREALYALPIEQLCGQLNAAMQVALDRPQDYKDLMQCLVCLADPVDVARVMFPPREAKAPRPPEEGDAQRRYDSFVDARNRVTHQAQRAIDALQIKAGFRWKFYLQAASIVLSGVIAGVGISWFGNIQDLGVRFLTALGVGILSGFLAPVARDLVASLQQLRKP